MNSIYAELVETYLLNQISTAKGLIDSDNAYSNLGRLLGRIDGAAATLFLIWPELDQETRRKTILALEEGTKIKGGQFSPLRDLCQAHHNKLSKIIF